MLNFLTYSAQYPSIAYRIKATVCDNNSCVVQNRGQSIRDNFQDAKRSKVCCGNGHSEQVTKELICVRVNDDQNGQSHPKTLPRNRQTPTKRRHQNTRKRVACSSIEYDQYCTTAEVENMLIKSENAILRQFIQQQMMSKNGTTDLSHDNANGAVGIANQTPPTNHLMARSLPHIGQNSQQIQSKRSVFDGIDQLTMPRNFGAYGDNSFRLNYLVQLNGSQGENQDSKMISAASLLNGLDFLNKFCGQTSSKSGVDGEDKTKCLCGPKGDHPTISGRNRPCYRIFFRCPIVFLLILQTVI